MLEILHHVNDKYCKDCEVGAAGKEVGYLCPGTCLDYAYDNVSAKYAFAMEIYEKEVDLETTLSSKFLEIKK
jgi:hypothetical protein